MSLKEASTLMSPPYAASWILAASIFEVFMESGISLPSTPGHLSQRPEDRLDYLISRWTV